MSRPRRRKPLDPFQIERALKSPPVGIGGGVTVINQWGERLAPDAVVATSMVCPSTYADARAIFQRLMADSVAMGDSIHGPWIAWRVDSG
jgi:hypothetical protein